MHNVFLDWDKLFRDAEKIEVPDIKYDNVIYTGMGASYIPGEMAKILELPFDYSVYNGDPSRFRAKGKFSLLAFSRSGDNIETLLVTRRAFELGADVICVSAGGKLAELCRERGGRHVNLSMQAKMANGQDYPSRVWFPLLFTALVKILNTRTGDQYKVSELTEGVESNKERALNLARRLVMLVRGKIPVFYGSLYFPVAIRFKQDLNETAKYPAFYGPIPESNHNDLEAYVKGQNLQPFVIGDQDIDYVTLSVIKAEQILPVATTPLRNVSYLVLLSGLTSLLLAEEEGLTEEEAFSDSNLKIARKLANLILK
ncbi:Bifunctional phosphoglucose/phosphomannose isomerase [Metallosphaera sp. J1]|uniref:SIS domain-containing protein n=1 Tax=Metallosphaera TaxID=41980 RepID=UPI001EDFCC2D|nr:SIS domain-containing protein [Metallosphaera javensis (ex Hofmann et al. 2022)]MCG3108538.1 Bifunctional phosphoglucose/phosphomannose isomerase [Metallosphaera javensis (ex Hofmann et al. 2022)]BCS91773.1 MAG: bifunctional phosphoglucose/phosphomannose isomerase [Metallosphaera javensis (ex Sakai et al. 2022)]